MRSGPNPSRATAFAFVRTRLARGARCDAARPSGARRRELVGRDDRVHEVQREGFAGVDRAAREAQLAGDGTADEVVRAAQ